MYIMLIILKYLLLGLNRKPNQFVVFIITIHNLFIHLFFLNHKIKNYSFIYLFYLSIMSVTIASTLFSRKKIKLNSSLRKRLNFFFFNIYYIFTITWNRYDFTYRWTLTDWNRGILILGISSNIPFSSRNRTHSTLSLSLRQFNASLSFIFRPCILKYLILKRLFQKILLGVSIDFSEPEKYVMRIHLIASRKLLETHCVYFKRSYDCLCLCLVEICENVVNDWRYILAKGK